MKFISVSDVPDPAIIISNIAIGSVIKFYYEQLLFDLDSVSILV